MKLQIRVKVAVVILLAIVLLAPAAGQATVSSSANTWSYAGNGVQTVFPYLNKIYEVMDLKVYLRNAGGVNTLQVYGSSYSVDGVLNNTGGNVTFTAAPAEGQTVLIKIELPLTQNLTLPEAGLLPSVPLERALDRAVGLVQQLKEELGRTFRLELGNTAPGELAAPAPNNVIGWDALGKNLTNYPLVPLAADIATIGQYHDSLSEAVATIGAGAKLLKIDKAVSLDSNLTVPENIQLWVTREGRLTVANTKTLTINGTLEAGLYQIFACAGSGKVVFGTQAVKEVHPEWWATNTTPGTTDMLAAIQSAVNSISGGIVRLAATTYKITDKIVWTTDNIQILGSGKGATTITTNNTTADIICVGDGTANPNNSRVGHLTITSSVAKSAGAGIRFRNGHNLSVYDIRLDSNMFTGIQCDGGSNQFIYHLSNFEINSGTTGIVVGLVGLVQDIWISDGNITNVTGTGLSLIDVSGYYLTGIDILLCGKGFVINPSTGWVVSGMCNRVMADTCIGNGFEFKSSGGLVADSIFTDCWSSSNGTGHLGVTNDNGIYISSGTNIVFNAPRILNNYGAGIVQTAGLAINYNGPQICSNSVAGSGVRSGIEFAAGVGKWSIIGGNIGKGGVYTATNNQKYGIDIAVGSSASFNISGVDVKDNVTGGIRDQSNGIEKNIHGNPGFTSSNRGNSAITTGGTYVMINHGLGAAPPASGITITATSWWPNGRPYLDSSSITNTQFKVLSSTTGGNEYFTWTAKIDGDY